MVSATRALFASPTKRARKEITFFHLHSDWNSGDRMFVLSVLLLTDYQISPTCGSVSPFS